MAQLKDTTINGSLNLVGEGASIYVNGEEYSGSETAPEFKESISMGRAEGTPVGTNSVAFGSDVAAITEGSVAMGVNTVAGGLGYFILGIETLSDTETMIYLSEQQVQSAPPVDKRNSYNTSDMETAVFNNPINTSVTAGDDIYILCPDNHYLFAGKVSYANENGLVVTEFDLLDDAEGTSNKIFNFDDLVVHWQGKRILPTDWSGTFEDLTQGIEGINGGEPLVGPRDYAVVICQQPTWGTVEVTQAGYAIGSGTAAVGDYSYAEGRDNATGGPYAHVEGRNTRAGYGAHAEGSSNFSRGRYSHTEGQNNTALGHSSHAEGNTNEVIGKYAHAEGQKNTAYGEASHIEGKSTNLLSKLKLTGAEDNSVLIEKWNEFKFSLAKEKESYVSGEDCLALGFRARAVGYRNIVTNHAGCAEGQLHNVSGNSAHAEGRGNTVSGNYAHGEGEGNIASGLRSHVEGYNTQATSHACHTEGNGCIAQGANCHAEGLGTKSTSQSGCPQHVQGKYNIEDTAGSYAHIVGNGTSDSNRKNAHTLDWKGNAWYAGGMTIEGDLTVNGTINGATGGGGSTDIDWANINEDTIYITTDNFNLANQAGEIMIDTDGSDVFLNNTMTIDMYGNANIQNSSGNSSSLTIGSYQLVHDFETNRLIVKYVG